MSSSNAWEQMAWVLFITVFVTLVIWKPLVFLISVSALLAVIVVNSVLIHLDKAKSK